MDDRVLFLQKLEHEHPSFLRVFRALPPNRLDYRPHPRSRSAAELVGVLDYSVSFCLGIVEACEIEWREPRPCALDRMVEAFDRNYRELIRRVEKLDAPAWETNRRLLEEGNVFMQAALRDILWLIFLDTIHHRGQLSTYIRPMGGKVPSIYGPSGDAAPA